MVGKSLLRLLKGEADSVYSEEETIGYELAGNAALFKGDYKIVKNREPVGDDQWHLFNIIIDPGETKDLKKEMPERFSVMMEAYRSYVAGNNVLPVPENYTQHKQCRNYAIWTQLKAHAPFYVAGFLILSIFFIIRKFNK